MLGMTGAFVSLALSKWSAKKAMQVRILFLVQDEAEKVLLNTVYRFSKQAGIRMPEVGIFPSPAANAFATGMNQNSALLAASTGLLENLTLDEIEAVVAHEMTHIINGDMVTMTLIQGVLNTFVFFFAAIVGQVVDRLIFQNPRGQGMAYQATQLLGQLTLGLLASLLVMWFSRYREFKADAGGASLAGKSKMIAALRALQREVALQELPGQFAAFGINGGKVKGLLMSHPNLAERIAALDS
jgi:heat shock protein HtpX